MSVATAQWVCTGQTCRLLGCSPKSPSFVQDKRLAQHDSILLVYHCVLVCVLVAY
eukprot:jgi/Botrbrau1/21445/Bobra.0216s0053.1